MMNEKPSSYEDTENRRESNDGFYSDNMASVTKFTSLPAEDKPAQRSYNIDDNDETERETWGKSIEFVLSCVGFAVGLGNVWRFPYLCYKNGGGVFLIPYIIFLIMGGMPLFLLEAAVGQFMGISGIKVWNIAPIFKGIGYATMVIMLLMNCYYIIIMAWNFFYMADTFANINGPLPWATCGNWWNTPGCQTEWFTRECGNSTLEDSNNTVTTVCNLVSNKGSDSVTEYFNNRILQISNGIDEVGTVGWQLALCLLVAWILVYFCVWKGVQWTGKVVYFTATFPYVVITILLVRGVTLDGAGEGLIFYLKPDFNKLNNIQVWIDAGTQIFYSYAVALGCVTAMGSYNKLNNNVHRQVLIISLINSGTSFYAGIAIFSTLGYMAHEQGVSIDDVTDKGPGLAFIAYPKATAEMPVVPHFWAILFFLMILFVGLDSQFVAVESMVTYITDMFPKHLRGKHRREILTAAYCSFSFLIGLTMVTNGGVYVFEMFNYYSASGFSLLWVSFFECAAVAWVYGVNRFYDNLQLMIGFKILPWFKICWLVLSPLACGLLFICMCIWFEPMYYGASYLYPPGAQAVGLLMAIASMICIPGYAIYAFVVAKGNFAERWLEVTTPVLEARQLSVTSAQYMNKEEYSRGDEMQAF